MPSLQSGPAVPSQSSPGTVLGRLPYQNPRAQPPRSGAGPRSRRDDRRNMKQCVLKCPRAVYPRLCPPRRAAEVNAGPQPEDRRAAAAEPRAACRRLRVCRLHPAYLCQPAARQRARRASAASSVPRAEPRAPLPGAMARKNARGERLPLWLWWPSVHRAHFVRVDARGMVGTCGRRPFLLPALPPSSARSSSACLSSRARKFCSRGSLFPNETVCRAFCRTLPLWP